MSAARHKAIRLYLSKEALINSITPLSRLRGERSEGGVAGWGRGQREEIDNFQAKSLSLSLSHKRERDLTFDGIN